MRATNFTWLACSHDTAKLSTTGEGKKFAVTNSVEHVKISPCITFSLLYHNKLFISDDLASSFVVQRGRSVPTLLSVSRSPQLLPRGKEHLNTDTKDDERGETEDVEAARNPELNVFERMKNIPVAGRPSELRSPSSHRRTSSSLGGEGGGNPSSRISRRNSIDENCSQLSIENLCGSQNNVHLIERSPDKEMRTHHVRDNRELEEGEEKHSSENKDKTESKVSFANLRKQKAHDQFHSSGISINYMQSEKSEASKLSRENVTASKPTRNAEPRHDENSSPGTSPGNFENALSGASPRKRVPIK